MLTFWCRKFIPPRWKTVNPFHLDSSAGEIFGINIRLEKVNNFEAKNIKIIYNFH
ncbi:Hypothetical protein KVN_LOCUS206 [uncultured virus]|nr:Hypothetical protein KVN_LOCUS206 [uncultured virus]